MASPVIDKHGSLELPEWIFRWRKSGDPIFPRLAALLISGMAFAIFLTMVRVRVVPPMQPEGRKASLIYLNPGPEAAAWALRAQEGGPFPSRFDPATWPGIQELEGRLLQDIRKPLPPYQPQLRDLPGSPTVSPVLLADRGEPVLPRSAPKQERAMDFTAMKLSPVIYPLSNLSPAELPQALPQFDAKIDTALSSTPWRLLVRLRADGSVAECVTLTGDSAPGTEVLEKWLQGVRFRPLKEKSSLWISIGVGFINTSVENGPVPH